tara:strand:+ start:1850 stop:2578 length:729 start_codon:yes stop_codon:yes gene_type:complete
MKNILISGVSRGLGLEITKSLLKKENICVYGFSRAKTKEFEFLKEKNPEKLKWMSYDMSNIIDIRNKIFKEFIGLKTPLHGFVNNAAISYDDIITNLNYEPLLKMYKINVFGPMMITKHVIRQFLLHNVKGSIVHVSSISAHTGYKGLAMYASSKGALEAFSKNSAREWGERGIRSNSLVAGFMETDMSSTLSVDQKNRIFKRTSMKVPTTKRSVSETIIFLLSESAESITGQNIHVDSGTI